MIEEMSEESAPYQEEGTGTSDRDNISRMTPATDNQEQDKDGGGKYTCTYILHYIIHISAMPSLVSQRTDRLRKLWKWADLQVASPARLRNRNNENRNILDATVQFDSCY